MYSFGVQSSAASDRGLGVRGWYILSHCSCRYVQNVGKYISGIRFSEVDISRLLSEEVCNESDLLTCEEMKFFRLGSVWAKYEHMYTIKTKTPCGESWKLLLVNILII